MTKFFRVFFSILLIAFAYHDALAQTFPCEANVRIMPPYSPYIADYYDPVSGKLQATLFFNDFNEPSWKVRLRLKIESGRIRMVTKPNFMPAQAIELYPGDPLNMQGSDFQQYFDYNNLDITGISLQDLTANGKFPEGFYNFCIEVLDYNTGKVLSRPSCATAYIRLSDEPVVISPQCGAVVPAFSQQNILFQWQFMNTASPVSQETFFKFFLYEVLDNQTDPMVALDNGRALLVYQEEDISNPSLLYNLAMPALETGKKYMFRVQAYDPGGKDLFKNNGFSQNCWFSYGYPNGGIMALQEPAQEHKFAENDPQTFQWSAPNNLTPGQDLNYKIRIVELAPDEDEEEVIESKTVWFEKQTISTSSRQPWQMMVEKQIEPQKRYAWKVYAYSKGQEIAESNVRIFTGPTLINSFRAGKHTVYVNDLQTLDMNNLSGTGRTKVFGNELDTALTEFQFTNIQIEKVAGRNVMTGGEIFIDVPDTTKILLTPKLERNNSADFFVDQFRLNPQGLNVNGYVKWRFPHPVNSSETPYLISAGEWMDFNDFKVFGTVKLIEGNNYELLEPFGFRINFQPNSDIFIVNNQYDFNLHGSVFLTEEVKDMEGNRISFDFTYKQQIFYFTQEDIAFSGYLHLIPNTKIGLKGKRAIIDLSATESPLKLSTDKEWKGVYFDKFEVLYPNDLDLSGQMALGQAYTRQYEVLMANSSKAWVGVDGLTSFIEEKFEERPASTFNTFPSELLSLKLEIEDNVLSDSRLKGTIEIPVIESGRKFDYTVPLTNGGFETGFLDEDLTGKSFVFSPYGGENRVDLTIDRAVFAQNERLDLIVDIEIPYISATLNDVQDFRIYGDYFIGFTKKNGSRMLSEHAEGNYDGFTMFLDKIGCGLSNGEYVFSYSATMPLGDEVSGTEGPPRLDIFSSAPSGETVTASTVSESAPPMDMPKPEREAPNPQTLSFDSLEIIVSSAIVDVNGYLLITKDDPQWGTSFRGGVNGTLKMPSRVSLGTNMILGTREQLKYWYMDAWFIDSEGQGIKVFNMFNIVAFEGKIYRHMAHNPDAAPSQNRPSFVIDPDVEFGTSLYMQLIDPGMGGKLVKSDVGIELVVQRDYFTVQMEGDVSIANTTGRNGPGLASLKREMVEKAAKEAAKQAVAKLVNLDLSIPVGSATLGIKADGNNGAFSVEQGDTKVTLEGKLAGVPHAGIKLVKAGHVFDLGGGVDGSGNIAYNGPDANFALGFVPSTGANLSLAAGGVEVSALYDKNRDFGSFNFAYDSKVLNLEVNKSEQSGKLAFAYDANKRFAASASRTGGSFEFQYDNVLLNLAADAEQQSGTLGVQVGETYFNAGLNKSLGTGSLAFQTGDMSYALAADRTGKGTIDVQVGSTSVFLDVDKPRGRGAIDVSVSGRTFGAYLDTSGMAGLKLGLGSTNIAMAIDKRAGAGSFLYDDGSRKIDIGANKSAGTGRVFIGWGSDSVVASLSPELKRLALAVGPTSFGIETDGQSSGSLHFQHLDKIIDVGANIQEQSGYLDLQNGADRIRVAANKTDRTGEFILTLPGIDVSAGIAPERNYLNFELEGIAFAGEGNSNGGSISFQKDDTKFGIGLLKSEGSGYVNFEQGTTKIAVEANRTERTGSLDLNIGDVAVAATIAPSLYTLSAKAPETDLSLSTDGSTKGELKIGVQDKRFALGADKTGQSGFFSMAMGADSLSLFLNKAKAEGGLAFSFADYAMSSGITPEKQFISLDLPQAKASITTETAGKGSLDLEVEDVKVHIDADRTNGTGAFSLIKANDSVAFATNLNNKTAAVLLAIEGTRFEGNYSPENQKIDLETPGNSFALERTGEYSGKLSATIAGNTFATSVDYQQKKGSVSLNMDQVQLSSSIDLTAKTGAMSVATGGIDYAMSVTESTKELSFKYADINVLAKSEEASKTLAFGYQDYKLGFAGNHSTGTINVGKGAFAISFSSDKKVTFVHNADNYTIDLASPNASTLKNGSVLTAIVNATGQGEINFADYTSNALNLKLIIDQTGKYLVYEGIVNIGVEASGNRYFKLNYQGNELNFYQNPQQTGFTMGDRQAYFTPQGELVVQADQSKSLKLSSEALGVVYNNYEVSLSKEAFNYSDGTRTILISPAKLALQQGDYSLAFTNQYQLSVAAGQDKTLTISPQSVSVGYEGVKVAFNNDPSFTYSDGTRNILLNSSELNIAQGDKSLALKSDKSLQLTAGSNSLSVSTQKAAFNYGSTNFVLIPGNSITYEDGSRTFEISKEELAFSIDEKTFKLTKELQLEMAAGTGKSLAISPAGVNLQYDDKKLSFGTDKSLSYEDSQRSFDFSGEGVELAQGSYLFKLNRNRTFELRMGDTKGLIINPDSAMLMYDGVEVALTADKSLRYQDPDRMFRFSREEVALQQGDKRMALNLTEKSIELENGEDQRLKLSPAGAYVQYQDKIVEFGTNKSLSYRDSERVFDIATTGLHFEYQDYLMDVVNDATTKSITLAKGSTSFSYSSGQAIITEGSNKLTLGGGDRFFELVYDNKTLAAGRSSLSYADGDQLISFGGTHFVELKQGERALTLSREKRLELHDGTRTVSFSAADGFTYADETRSFGIGGSTNLLAYTQGGITYRLYSPSRGKYGLGIQQSDYGLDVQIGRNSPAALVATTPYGNLNVTTDPQSNLNVGFTGGDKNIVLKSGRQGLSITGLDIAGPGAVDMPDNLSTAAEVPEAQGPQYIGKITDGADGRAKGHIEMYFNSRDMHFIANASVKSVIPPCIEGALAAEASPETWRVDIGTETERVSVYPSCSGFGGGGWLNLTPQSVGVGVFAGFRAGGSVDIGAADITALVEAELGVRAKVTIDPEFYVNEAGVWVRLYAGLKVDPAIGSTFTVAEAELKGTLTLYFYESHTQVNGELSGHISVCGISGGFDMGFDEQI